MRPWLAPNADARRAFGKGADIGLIQLIFVIPLLFGVRVTVAALTMVSDSWCLVAADNDVLAVRGT